MQILIKWVIVSVVIIASAYIFPGIAVDNFLTAFAAAIAIGLVTVIIRPILLILTLPITILTLGLFTFVINAFLIMLVAILVPGFAVANFFWALLLSLILSVINFIKE